MNWVVPTQITHMSILNSANLFPFLDICINCLQFAFITKNLLKFCLCFYSWIRLRNGFHDEDSFLDVQTCDDDDTMPWYWSSFNPSLLLQIQWTQRKYHQNKNSSVSLSNETFNLFHFPTTKIKKVINLK